MDRLLLICVVVAITPASILLLLVITIGLGIEDTFLQIGKVSDWVNTIISSATLFIAYRAYTSWKEQLSTPRKIELESEIIETLHLLSDEIKNASYTFDSVILNGYYWIKHQPSSIPDEITTRYRDEANKFLEKYNNANHSIGLLRKKLKESHPAYKPTYNLEENLLNLHSQINQIKKDFNNCTDRIFADITPQEPSEESIKEMDPSTSKAHAKIQDIIEDIQQKINTNWNRH